MLKNMSKIPKKIAVAKEKPTTINVSFLVSGKVGQLMRLNSCWASWKKFFNLVIILYDANLRMCTNDTNEY